MTVITIPLTDEHLTKLRELADRIGLSPEEFLRRRVDSWLERPNQEFINAASQVLEKNAELYRRLA
jgi:antitoxin FitA